MNGTVAIVQYKGQIILVAAINRDYFAIALDPEQARTLSRSLETGASECPDSVGTLPESPEFDGFLDGFLAAHEMG